ncbi:multi-sensor hybrid histidine kinase [Chthoniobacter flavus Ellin428]|uniref:histidine kinase n=1 Tax=Chthoniobacter flavus Ellin428 TaxID=497964 RepID=B4DC58_9BACT|nr:response regulator [Chthoniobacter flavus]EDY15980.1 multi-sensor hybrid histidine kinase [Chthoniobacter flavus Ellin428]TCO83294.1 phospho-acceptor domain-containing protein [Chthoniobacter flavus]
MNTPLKMSGRVLEILVAEDSPTQAQRLRHILEQQGYKVTVAGNGRIALDAARRSRPSLIISDVVMPEMDGYELCRRIKSDPDLADVPVILVTTMSDPEDVIRGLECRADNFILKPYDESYLVSRLQFVIVNREMRQSEQPGMGLEIFFNGQRHFIAADRLQILNLLLSTYDAAIQRNRELSRTQTDLQQANSQLHELTAALEGRVALRTRELALSNEALREEVAERQRAQQRLQGQLSRLDLLSRTTRAIGERQDLHSIFQVVVRSLEEHLPVDFCCVCLSDLENSALTVECVGVRSAETAMELAMTESARIAIDQNGLSQCVRGQLVYEPDIAAAVSPFPQRLARGGLKAFVAAPLLVESKVFGVLIAARREAGSFSSGDCEFLRQLSEHVALAANQAQLHAALQQAYDDLRRTQQAVMQQERLRALGQMASGIAHDINNAISPITLYTESLLENDPSLSTRARNYLETIQHAIEDVAETVARMREFYREREPQMTLTRVQINRLVEQVLNLTHARWSDIPQQRGKMIEMRTELAEKLPEFMGVESEIRDALTNLIINAADAMPEGGTLTLRTRKVNGSASENGAPISPRVCVEISDTGIGMDEETRRRCLEPFYTTKGERGTGLGLAMVYGMAQRHAGEIEIDSERGRGTTVRLMFPVADVSPAAVVISQHPRRPVQRLRLLVIDDDPLLIMALRDILEGDGHSITAADGGQRGIDAFLEAQSTGATFDAVFTDLGMPYVDGRKVSAAVKEASPATPVILLTGWGQRLMTEGDVPPHVDRVLNKPPKLRELREALSQLCPEVHA